jgi:hypothetical protein
MFFDFPAFILFVGCLYVVLVFGGCFFMEHIHSYVYKNNYNMGLLISEFR